MKITDERIEEIREAEKAATEGPWEVEVDGPDLKYGLTEEYETNIVGPRGDMWVAALARDAEFHCDNYHANASFIAMARTSIPELLSEREEREKEIELLNITLIGAQGDRDHALIRAESVEKALEALREWALTARRLWGGGGGVHWKSFYAILDGKPRP